MIRCASLAIALTGCLDTPPGAIDDPAPSSLLLAGVDARGGMILDDRDDLVITGVRRDESGAQPVAIVLFASDSGIPTAVAAAGVVELDVEASQVAINRREDLTGLAVLLASDGTLMTFDQELTTERLAPTDAGTRLAVPFDRVATLETSPGQRVLLAQEGDLWVTDQLEIESDLSAIPAHRLSSGGTIQWLDGADAAGTHVVASMTAAGEIDTRVFLSGDPPSLDPDLVSESSPAPLGSVLWRGTSHDFIYLVAIDQDIPRVFWHRTPVGDGEITSGFAVEGTYDLIRDLTFAVVGGGTPDLLVLGERDGMLVVDMYRDPLANDAFDIGSPTSWTVPSDLAPPVWIEAMDAVSGDSGNDEIIVYDQAGHVVCADRVDAGLLSSCGSADLSELVGG